MDFLKIIQKYQRIVRLKTAQSECTILKILKKFFLELPGINSAKQNITKFTKSLQNLKVNKKFRETTDSTIVESLLRGAKITNFTIIVEFLI